MDTAGRMQTMLDLIIRGGDVVTPQGVGNFDVAVLGERIAAVAAAGTLADDTAQRIIDASGKIVMPGGVDPTFTCTIPGSSQMAQH